jgi:hypothetical protein
MEQIDIAKARNLKALSEGALVERSEKQFEHSGEEGVINFLAPEKGLLLTHASRERHEMIRDPGL